MVIATSPVAAPNAQVRESSASLSASSWRTWPKVKDRRNVPSVDGAITRWPRTRRVAPARKTSQSSMELGARHHGVHEGEHLAARKGSTGTVPEVDQLVGQCEGPELIRQGGHESEAGAGHRVVVVEGHCKTGGNNRTPCAPERCLSVLGRFGLQRVKSSQHRGHFPR